MTLLDMLGSGVPLRIPATPVDRVNPLYARQWRLLQRATRSIPAGQSYTVIARDPDHEMLLFMLSLGVLPDRVARPTNYWKIPQHGNGDRARYVLAYDCAPVSGGARLVRRYEEGCVWERAESAP